uniref:Sialin-like n=1 Tax=Hirondellea gigas TaxID=1518452 RepID=A0A2P2HW34_9CRUS
MDGEERKCKDFIPARWIFTVLGSVGFMVVYGLKVNLSVAIMAMVNHTAVALESSHGDDHHGDSHAVTDGLNATVVVDDCDTGGSKEEALMDGPFVWNENIQGVLLASYFYGYLLTQVAGGWVAEKFSAKHVFGVGALLNIVGTLLTPLAANISFMAMMALRVVMGIGGGVTLPAMHVLVARWAPPAERSKIASAVYAGMTLGTLFTMPFSGILASTLGWEFVFYVQGVLSILWYILWVIFVFDSPSQHPRITRTERQMIDNSIGGGSAITGPKPSVPWKAVWTSMPVWAIIVAHTCSNWGWYMLLVKLPTFMRYILKFDIKSNAGLSAVPFLCMWIFTMLFANLLDLLRAKNILSTTAARKISTSIASLPPAIFLILVTYVGCNTDLAVVFLTLGTMFLGGMYSGFLANHIDIAPAFAGTLMGITNTFATIPGIIVPSVVGIITHNNQTVEAWRLIFIITFVIFAIEFIFYNIFGSGELQEWAKPKPIESQNEHRLLEQAESKAA